MADTDYTMQELLSVQTITDLIQDKAPQEQILVLAELKQQASKQHCVRDFNDAVKLARQQLAQKQKGEPLKDIPECIEDDAGYRITEFGVFQYLIQTGAMLEICPYPLFITERYTDLDDGTEKVKLVFKRDGEWRETIQPRTLIASSTKITQLAEQATGITSENAKGVVRYLSDIESANRYTIPVKRSVARLGWTDYGFVPFIDDIEFTGAEQYAQLYDNFKEAGDFETWRELSVQCLAHPIPRIIVAASYASLLLQQIGVNGFSVHVWGESGRGKTVALMLGASVYGNADPKNGIIRNGKTTSNGLEPVLGFFNNVPVFYDELTTLSQEQITDMVYKQAQGQGKGRMTKASGLQKTFTWNNVAIFSAEKPLGDSKTMSGAINRVLSIYTDGAVFGDSDMVYIANALKENYGFGAKRFINSIQDIDFLTIYAKYITSIDSDIEQKQANAAAVLLTAYEIAAKYVYNTDIQLTVDDLLPFLAKKTDVSVSMRAYDNIVSYIEANYTMFDDSEINQSKWGWYGFKGKTLHMYYARFQEWCQRNGYQEQALLREWRNRELIKTRNKHEFKNNAKHGDVVYTDIITIVMPEKTTADLLTEVEDEPGQLPF